MNIFIFSCDVLNSFEMPTSSKLFNVKYQVTAASEASAAANAKTAEKQLTIAEPASQPTAATITIIAAAKNAEKQSKTATKTAAKTATKTVVKIAAKSASKSYAQVAVADSQEQNWQLVQNKKKTATATNKAANTKSASLSYIEKRLILLESKNQEIDSMKIRNQINQELEKQLKLAANKPVLAAIIKSQIQQNVVLITTDNYNADFLIQHEKIWSKFFKYATTRKDFTWHKIVAHDIPTDIFNCSKELDLLKQEIEIYNGIQPIAINWLSTSQNRQEKMHASAVIAFDSEEAAQKALKKRLLIADISIKTAIFKAKS